MVGSAAPFMILSITFHTLATVVQQFVVWTVYLGACNVTTACRDMQRPVRIMPSTSMFTIVSTDADDTAA